MQVDTVTLCESTQKKKKKNKEKKKEGHEVLPPVPGGQGLNGRMRKRQ